MGCLQNIGEKQNMPIVSVMVLSLSYFYAWNLKYVYVWMIQLEDFVAKLF